MLRSSNNPSTHGWRSTPETCSKQYTSFSSPSSESQSNIHLVKLKLEYTITRHISRGMFEHIYPSKNIKIVIQKLKIQLEDRIKKQISPQTSIIYSRCTECHVAYHSTIHVRILSGQRPPSNESHSTHTHKLIEQMKNGPVSTQQTRYFAYSIFKNDGRWVCRNL